MPDIDSAEPVQQYLRREQVARLAQQLPVNLLANLCVVIAFFLTYYGKLPIGTLITWAIYSQLVNIFGVYLSITCRQSDEAGLDSCLKKFTAYALSDGLTFAVAMWIFFIPTGGFYNIFLFTVLLGISAGGQATLLSHLASAMSFSLSITVAAVVRLATSGDHDYLTLAGLALVFSSVLIWIAMSFNRNLMSTWRLRYELENELGERQRVEKGLRESEQRYRHIVELSPDAIVVQQDGRIVYANDSATRLFGIVDINTLQSFGVVDFVPEFQRQAGQDVSLRPLETQDDPVYLESDLKRADGREIEVELRSKAIFYNGRPALQLIIQDISERKQMDKMKDEFISIVSHELRTPITAILGAVGILRGLQMDSFNDKQQQLINIIYNNSQTLTGLVNDILDVSKLEGGKLTLKIESCDLPGLLDEVIKDNTTYASQYGIVLDLKSDLSVSTIETDPMRLKQILNNLISNAIKHSPEHNRVEIHATNADRYLMMSVQDHGSGIPKAFHERIFHKFEQSQENSRKVIKGTGLGLYLTKSLVEQFDGEIWYETEENFGTTFYVKLPVI